MVTEVFSKQPPAEYQQNQGDGVGLGEEERGPSTPADRQCLRGESPLSGSLVACC